MYKRQELEENIKNLNIDNTLWNRSLEIFEDRFTVPYKMKISNLKGAIIGENLPRVEFIFEKGENQASLDRSNLEKLDVLSQGEKRSLYLLNIIFDIEKIRKESNEILFIVDDIAAVSYTHLTLPTIAAECRSRWSPYH